MVISVTPQWPWGSPSPEKTSAFFSINFRNRVEDTSGKWKPNPVTSQGLPVTLSMLPLQAGVTIGQSVLNHRRRI